MFILFGDVCHFLRFSREYFLYIVRIIASAQKGDDKC